MRPSLAPSVVAALFSTSLGRPCFGRDLRVMAFRRFLERFFVSSRFEPWVTRHPTELYRPRTRLLLAGGRKKKEKEKKAPKKTKNREKQTQKKRRKKKTKKNKATKKKQKNKKKKKIRGVTPQRMPTSPERSTGIRIAAYGSSGDFPLSSLRFDSWASPNLRAGGARNCVTP